MLIHKDINNLYADSGADLGGPRGPVPPFKNFLLICYCYYKQHENFIQ